MQNLHLAIVTSGAAIESLSLSVNPIELAKLTIVVPSERVKSIALRHGVADVVVVPDLKDETLLATVKKLIADNST